MNRSVTLQRQGCRLDREGGIWLRSSVPRGERLRRAGRRCSECCKSFSGAAAGALLFAAAQDRSHDARTAATMNYGDYEHGYFIGSIDDEVLSYRVEAQGPRSQIQALVALMGKEHRDHAWRAGFVRALARQRAELSSAMYSQMLVMSCAASG